MNKLVIEIKFVQVHIGDLMDNSMENNWIFFFYIQILQNNNNY